VVRIVNKSPSVTINVNASGGGLVAIVAGGSQMTVMSNIPSPTVPADWNTNSYGDAFGPGSSVDNAIVRFDGTTGKVLQSSLATIDDSGVFTSGPSTAQIATYSVFNGIKGVGSSYLGWGLLSGTSATILAADSAGVLEFYSDSKTNITSGSITGTKTASVTATGAWTWGPTPGSSLTTTFHKLQSNGPTVTVIDTSSHVEAYSMIRFRRNGADRCAIGVSGQSSGRLISDSAENDFCLYTNTHPIRFSTNGGSVSYLLLDTNGAFTVGNPSAGAQVSNTLYGYTSGGQASTHIRNVSVTAGGDILRLSTATTSGTVSGFVFYDGSGFLCGYSTIDTAANTISYVNTSDARLKHLFEDFNGLGLIAQMKPWQYERKVQAGKKEIGFVAQEMESVFPQAVTTATDEFQTMGIDYSKFTPVLVKALQELKAELDVAKARIEALESGN